MTEQPQTEEGQQRTITRHEFYFETPLYEYIDDESILEDLRTGEVDAYSTMYKTPTTYTISSSAVAENYYTEFNGYRRISLKNKRKDDDVLVFFVIRYKEGYTKVGQMPSLADLQYSEITEKYSKQLNNENLILFKKAIGLAAHGVGAGSFVYLRRIFETLIKETFEAHKSSLAVTKEVFLKQRMTDKVETLDEFLPSQLVEMKEVYSILSSGVHELSEEECLVYFHPIKLSIELILDQQIEEQTRIERDKRVKSELKKIASTLKSKN